MRVQGRLINKQVTRRPGNIGPEEWSSISKSSQRKAINKWAREQRGIYQIPDDGPGCDEVVYHATRKIGDKESLSDCLERHQTSRPERIKLGATLCKRLVYN